MTERFKWSPRVASRTLEETAFILNQSQMVSLNPVGTFVWDQLKGLEQVSRRADRCGHDRI